MGRAICRSRLNGMFAFAVFDAAAGRLFLARDRFGEKPLYYAERPGVFAFASEITALVRTRRLRGIWTRARIQKLFAYGFIPAPRLAIRGVAKLPAGWTLSYDCRTGTASSRPFWRFRLEPDDALADRDEPRWSRSCARCCCRRPYGAADQRRPARDLPERRARFGDRARVAQRARPGPSDLDVHGRIRGALVRRIAVRRARVAARSGRDTTIRLRPRRRLRADPDVLARLDEPLADPSLIPTYLLCRFARQR